MNRGKWGVVRLGVVVVALLLATTAPAASAAATGASGFDAPESTSNSLVEAVDPPERGDASDDPERTDGRFVGFEPPPENNSSISHRNPDEVESDSGGTIGDRLFAATGGDIPEGINVSEADRERARQLINNNSEYAELAERYGAASVEESGNASRLRTVGVAQQAFFADVQRYRQVHQKYERARRADRPDRTRRFAHQLERHLRAINRSARFLNRSYANLSAAQQESLGNVTRTVGDVRSNVTATQRTVRQQTLVRTRLSVEANRSTASFTDPVELAGRLVTANGTPVADRNVTLAIDNRTVNVTTDRQGRFETTYRPVLAATGTHRRTVEFRPANASVYRWSNATTRFAVEQIAPTVRITNRTSTVRYNETVGVGGRVTADGVGVADVPLAVTVGDVQVARTRTGPNGSFAASARLPANVSTGRATVAIRLPVRPDETAAVESPSLSNRALAPTNATARVAVKPTATTLSIAEVRPIEDAAFVTGRLRTADGDPISNGTVELRVGGEQVGTATTNATGGFAASVDLPPGSRDGDPVGVSAVFRSSGNLEASRANATATLSASESPLDADRVRFAIAGLLGVAVLGVAAWRFRSDDDEGFDRNDEEVAESEGDGGGRDRLPEVLLESAAAALDDEEYDAAAEAAYASVRERLRRAEAVGAGDGTAERAHGPRTHWEFYDDCRDAGLADDRLADLKELTEAYERAAFAADHVSPGDAASAVEVARSYAPDPEAAGAVGGGREESAGRGLGEGSTA